MPFAFAPQGSAIQSRLLRHRSALVTPILQDGLLAPGCFAAFSWSVILRSAGGTRPGLWRPPRGLRLGTFWDRLAPRPESTLACSTRLFQLRPPRDPVRMLWTLTQEEWEAAPPTSRMRSKRRHRATSRTIR